jgi:hypothetical protein
MSTAPPNTPYPPGTPIQQPVAAGQPVVIMQPVAGQAPVVLPPSAVPQQVVIQPAAAAVAPPIDPALEAKEAKQRQHEQDVKGVIIYSHSNFFYWWPVWVCGYIMAAITWFWGSPVTIPGDSHAELFHPSKDLGVIFTLTFFLVILITNVTVRGLSSLVVILCAVLAVVLSLYFGWWETLATAFSLISIHMNMGFYVCFSTMIFIVWFLAVFVFDRMSYFKVTPGQVTHEFVIGGAAKSYDPRGMVFEKRRNDLFRHWILGLGSGDIIMSTTGAVKETIMVPNVLFVDGKVAAIQHLIAMQPDEFEGPTR